MQSSQREHSCSIPVFRKNKHPASEHITAMKRRHTNGVVTVEVHTTHGDGGKRGSGAHGYLGAMNTCPSDSKLFGSSASKSATERGED